MRLRNIAVVGMPQSGTTALLNIVAEILELKGIKYNSFLYGPHAYSRVINAAVLDMYERHLENKKSNKSLIIKEHHHVPFLKSWADLVFLAKRDIRDSIASRRRRGKGLYSKGYRTSGLHNYDATTFEAFKNWCVYLTDDCYDRWLPVAYEFCYEDYVKDRQSVVLDISKILKAENIDAEKVLFKIDNLCDETNLNFFTKSKITAGGKVNNFHNEMSEKELKHIQDNYSDWICEEESEGG